MACDNTNDYENNKQKTEATYYVFKHHEILVEKLMNYFIRNRIGLSQSFGKAELALHLESVLCVVIWNKENMTEILDHAVDDTVKHV